MPMMQESSSYDDLNGAACWARVIASHWVLQGFTSSIMWFRPLPPLMPAVMPLQTSLMGAHSLGANW